MAPPPATMRCAVLGAPIAHSLSPAMHRAAYAELGLDWTYDAIEVGEDALESFLADVTGEWRGLSLTMPLKRVALELVDVCSDVATAVGGVNTILFDDGSSAGENTDVPGAMAALREHGLDEARTARIVGAGATAASIGYALGVLGIKDVEFFVRDVPRAERTVQVVRDTGVEVRVLTLDDLMLEKVDLLVSTVPGDAIGSRSHELVESARAVFDIAYDPWPTALVTSAEQHGLDVVTGLDLLAHQAAAQVALMTGEDIDPDLLRQTALVALAR